ncbi:MAG: tRNA (adenosine(37)-N6)-threonylcarbamoyltransferase complex ATPase subunit type 1 TsaE [Tannerellaceae bacterium]|jgi:tRNA threonylcarbamoyladenosine biosynthesis protein TsaE|nr:tRNA (adenosine(37)-N6)-threonylcarbamoyltransferase complex ATPase subunit type 1 TsaE [Tannerellaceae bacterium]
MRIRFALDDIAAAAARFLPLARKHSLIAFHGDMGAGKTTFIKALCEQMGVAGQVSSPSFAIINEYADAAGRSIYHFDFYRINTLREAIDIGTEEYFDGHSLCLVEWPDVVEPLLPPDTLHVALRVEPDGSRTLSEAIYI